MEKITMNKETHDFAIEDTALMMEPTLKINTRSRRSQEFLTNSAGIGYGI